LGCSLLIAPEIWAFFPIAIYDSAGLLRYRTYRINDFDQNNDGQIGEDEGIDILLEGGRSGFTDAELLVVEDALAVWERVPQSYASFRVEGVVEDAIVADGFSDGRNSIVMYVASTVDLDDDGLPDENVVPDPPGAVPFPPTGGVLGYNISTWSGEDTIIETPSESYLVSVGTIIDNDIVIGADAHRSLVLGEAPLASLHSTMVHELGHFLGLDHTPVNNLTAQLVDSSDPTSFGNLVETPVLVHSVAGVKNRIGVTPTMFPFAFSVTTDGGDLIDGGSDLAPDDISGMAALYPRGSQDLFFGLRGEARTHTRPGTGIPSVQIPVAHVVAWADVDNDETTPRVAVFSTYTSYYENPVNIERDGRFNLRGMWKTMETESGLFNATYTYTLSPLTGTSFERQAPPVPAVVDPLTEYIILSGNTPPLVAFPSEVLHEVENIIDISNADAGTPFVWDFQRSTLMSVDTERTIESIVGDGPMFGDPNDVCILNVVGSAKAGGSGGGLASAVEGANTIRTMRDGLLLETALGSFIVDTYYKVSPTAAKLILSNHFTFAATVRFVDAIYWCLNHLTIVFLSLLGLATAGTLIYKRRMSKMGVAAMFIVVSMLSASTVEARAIQLTTEQLVAGASDVISGKVVSAESRTLTTSRHVVTDVVIEIEDKAKGTLNKQSTITFTQVGGRANGRITEATEMPTFTAGEEVVLYLYLFEEIGYVVYSGDAGKVPVRTNALSGSKTVKLSPAFRASMAKRVKSGEEVPEEMDVAAYMAELRAIAKSQEKQ